MKPALPSHGASLLRVLVFLISLCVPILHSAPAFAGDDDAGGVIKPRKAPVDDGDFRIAIVTMGPGDHPFLKFGHNAIWVEDLRSRTTRLYNFGTFSFSSPSLITDFLQGRLLYWLSVQTPRALDDYRRQNRSLFLQELNLSREQRRAIAESLRINAQPENRAYKYDYYLDNCATRVRDVIDKHLDGKLHAATRGPATMSFRAHTLRLVADDIPLYIGLHLALGRAADRPITEWDEMFLPGKLQEYVRRVQVPEQTAQVPLVKREATLFQAKRDPVRSEPPTRAPWALLCGVLLAGAFAFTACSKRRSLQVLFGVLLSLVGLLAGFLGLVFVFFWGLTDHEIAHANENIAQCAPWVVALAVTAIASAVKPKWQRMHALNFWLTGAAFAAAVLGVLLKVLPSFYQDNAFIIAFMLPVWLGAAYGSRMRMKRAVA